MSNKSIQNNKHGNKVSGSKILNFQQILFVCVNGRKFRIYISPVYKIEKKRRNNLN